MTTESSAAMARMSAHETTPGQAVSTAVFISSITSNPLVESLLGLAFFSPVKFVVSSSNNDPSHPYMQTPRINYEENILTRNCINRSIQRK